MRLIKNFSTRIFDPGNLVIWALSSCVAAFMGPFGTFIIQDTPERMLFWAVLVGWGLGLIALAMSIAEVYLPDLTYEQEELGRLIIMPPIIIGTMFPVVNLYFLPDPVPITFFHALLACYLLGGIVTVARLTIVLTGRQRSASEEGPRLLRRLPEGAAGPILRLSGRDHFVEVVTAEASYSIRMRLADAIEEMDGVDGFLTHRSHWVARAAIVEVKRSGQRHVVVSKDAEMIPVSKSKLPELENAGLL
ncbi:MAG: LytTR family DNA-binding domain-containing protein [Pseudomonadota bacterium]